MDMGRKEQTDENYHALSTSIEVLLLRAYIKTQLGDNFLNSFTWICDISLDISNRKIENTNIVYAITNNAY